MDKWDYNTSTYKNSANLRARCNFNYESINENINRLEEINFHTAGGMQKYELLTWKQPISVSINDLPQVKLKQMIVPNEENRQLKVIGIDLIYHHTIIISSSNGKMDFKILPGSLQNNDNIPTFQRESSILTRLGMRMLEHKELDLLFLYSNNENSYDVCLDGYKIDNIYDIIYKFSPDCFYDDNKLDLMFYRKDGICYAKVIDKNKDQSYYITEIISEFINKDDVEANQVFDINDEILKNLEIDIQLITIEIDEIKT